ncbi:MAG: fibronectin type III domain-containing protein [Flavobacteriaceae bacterium]|nr:fibronectin type III domain-containing protein [Flavobacteriaceae bacterium]
MKLPVFFVALFLFIHTAFSQTPPSLFTPANGSTNQAISVNLDWSSVSGNTGYPYQIDTVSTFDSPQLISNTTANNISEVTINGLSFGTTYYWRVKTQTATGTSDWSTVFNFTTANSITLYSPTNGTTDQPIALTLDWSSLTGNTGYKYQYDTVNTFDSPNLVTNTTATNISEIYISNLAFNTTYYWRVAVLGATGQSGWSTVFNFKTANNITLYMPTNGAIDQPIALTLDWSSLTGNTGYKYQYDTVNTFDSPNLVTNTTVANSSEIYISNLAFNTTYYWRVAVLGATGQSGWSTVFNFKTANNITLYTPTNGTIDQPIALTLDWSSLTGNTGYKYQYDTVNTFDSPNLVTNTTVANSSEIYISNLAFNTTYYWRVAVLGATGQSGWSTVFNFKTANSITLYTPTNGTIDQPIALTLDWSSLTGNTGYKYQYDTVNTFDSPNFVTNTTVANSSEIYISNLAFNTTYYWRAAVMGSTGQSGWSTVFNFTTGNQVTLYTPANGAVNQTTTLTLDWSSFTGNNGYVYQLDTQPSFDSPNFQTGNLGANISQVTINGLTLNQTYYWRVAIRNTYSQSAWSNVWAFATGASLSNDTAWIGNIQIFPNPVIEVLKIQLPENTTPLSYFLFNAYGQMLQQGIIESSQATISMSKFPSGVYFLRLENPLEKVHFNTTLVKE